MAEAYLSLGSNMGDKRDNIARALALIAGPDIAVTARSRDYRTPPWGPVEQDWFVNACAKVETRLGPQALLARALEVERAMGRVRDVRWGPRLIDIDILAMDGVVLDRDDLILPHPRLLERAFVLVPLAEIAPDLRVAGTTAAAALAGLDPADVEGVVPIAG